MIFDGDAEYNGPGVYKIECLRTGYAYIGGTTKVRQRYMTHRKHLVARKHANAALQYAWDLLGSQNFVFSVIEICLREQVFAREVELQKQHKGPLFSRVRHIYPIASRTGEARQKWSEQAKKQHEEGTWGTVEHRKKTAEAGGKNLTRYNKSEKARKTSQKNMERLIAEGRQAPWTEERKEAARIRTKERHARGELGTPEQRAASRERLKKMHAAGLIHTADFREASRKRVVEQNRDSSGRLQ